MTTKIELPLPITQIERKPLKRPQIALELPRVPTQPPPLEIVSKAPQIDSVQVSFTETEFEVEQPQVSIQSLMERFEESPEYLPLPVAPVIQVAPVFSRGATGYKPVQNIADLFDPSISDGGIWSPTPVKPVVNRVQDTVPMFPELGGAKPPDAVGHVYLLTRTQYFESGAVDKIDLIRIFTASEVVADEGLMNWFTNSIIERFKTIDSKVPTLIVGLDGKSFNFQWRHHVSGNMIEIDVVPDFTYFTGDPILTYKVRRVTLGAESSVINLYATEF